MWPNPCCYYIEVLHCVAAEVCDVSAWYGDTPGIRLSPSLAWRWWPPTTRQPKKSKALHIVLAFSILCPMAMCSAQATVKAHSMGLSSSPFSVLDRLLTRLSALYCQCSCQATILLENTGLLQLAQAVITLQIQALKKQNNSQNDPNNLAP